MKYLSALIYILVNKFISGNPMEVAHETRSKTPIEIHRSTCLIDTIEQAVQSFA